MTTASNPARALAAMGIVLPDAPKPVAAYVPFVRAGDLLFISGQLPFAGGTLMAKGSVPGQVSVEVAQQCARQCAINVLAVVQSAVGDLAKVSRVVRLGVFVCSDVGFSDQPKVANAASELLVQVFGEAGRHARAAVGSVALPLNACVEVDAVIEVAG